MLYNKVIIVSVSRQIRLLGFVIRPDIKLQYSSTEPKYLYVRIAIASTSHLVESYLLCAKIAVFMYNNSLKNFNKNNYFPAVAVRGEKWYRRDLK